MSEIPDSAMATGNDEGEPGQPDTRSLTPDEQRLLEALERPAVGPDIEDAAAADVSPVPPAPEDDGGDGLEPEFTDR